jgi:hypothetical protein
MTQEAPWLVGSILRVTTLFNEVVDGEVYAYDPHTASVVLRLLHTPPASRLMSFQGVEGTKRAAANSGEFRCIRDEFIKSSHCIKKQAPTLPEPSFVDVEGLRSKEETVCAEELKSVPLYLVYVR